MAARDILPYRSAMGGWTNVLHYRLDTGQTFLEGEPVSVDAGGHLVESADDAAAEDLLGIALLGPGAGLINPKTNVAYAQGDLIPVIIPSPGDQFITSNWSVAGSAFNDTAPALTNLQDEMGLSLISGVWGVDISATNNTCRFTDVLNAQFRSMQEPNITAVTTADTYYIVFEITAHQTSGVTAPSA